MQRVDELVQNILNLGKILHIFVTSMEMLQSLLLNLEMHSCIIACFLNKMFLKIRAFSIIF